MRKSTMTGMVMKVAPAINSGQLVESSCLRICTPMGKVYVWGRYSYNTGLVKPFQNIMNANTTTAAMVGLAIGMARRR